MNPTAEAVVGNIRNPIAMDTEKSTTRYWTVDRIVNMLIALAVATVLVLLIRRLSNVLLPFFIACVIAYILQPMVDLNQRILRLKSRTIPSVLTLLDVLLIIGAVIYFFIPSVVKELDMLGHMLHNASSDGRPMPVIYMKIVSLIERYFNPDYVAKMLDSAHIDTIISKGSSLLEESISVIAETLSWLLTIIYILFILIDYRQIMNGFRLIIPHPYRARVMVVVKEVESNMNSYFRGQGKVAACAAVLYCIGFSIVGLPLAIPMGLLVGILYMIPYFQYITLVPVALICFVYSLGGDAGFFSMLGQCLLVYVVSQSVCDYIITPHIMGKAMGLNPAVILLALSVWGSLLGIIGMIIALPATALIMTYYRRYISEPAPRKKKRRLS